MCVCVCVCARLCFDLTDHDELLSKLPSVALNEGNPKSYTLHPTHTLHPVSTLLITLKHFRVTLNPRP